MKKVCPNCGAEADGNFCPECGTNLTDVIPQEALSTDDKIENVTAPLSEDALGKTDAVIEEPKVADITTSEVVASASTVDAPDSKETKKPKKTPKKLIAIIAVAIIAVVGVGAFMFLGSGPSVISQDFEAGSKEQKIGELTYLMPESWEIDSTYNNPNAFYEVQRYLVKDEEGKDLVDCYVKYCGESRYYGNALSDYDGQVSGYDSVSDEKLTLSGAEGKHVCVSSTDTEGNANYIDTFIVEANGSIFSFEFNTKEDSHDQNGMNTIVSNAKYEAYQSPVGEAVVAKGKFTVTADAFMRELICEMNKNNDTENLGCGEFTYTESSTKGGALCYSIEESGFSTGVAISFYKDKKEQNSISTYKEVPVEVAVATSLSSLLDYKDTTITLINGTIFQLTGGINFDQGYSKYVNGVDEATGYTGQNWYTNSLSLNDFDYEIAFDTKDYAVYVHIS